MISDLTFTTVGIAALADVQRTGVVRIISHVAYGTESYTPTKTQTSLRAEVERIEVSTPKIDDDPNADDEPVLAEGEILLVGVFKSDKSYDVREVGYFLDDGTLLAVQSQEDFLITHKSPDIEVILEAIVGLSDLPPNSIAINFGSTDLKFSVQHELNTMATAIIQSQCREVEHHFELVKLKQKIEEFTR